MGIEEIKYFAGIAEESSDAAQIIKEAVELGMSAMYRDYSGTGLTTKFSLGSSEYDEKNTKIKQAILAFCGANSGVTKLEEKRHIAMAFDNNTFVSIYNAIIAESILGVITKTTSPQIMAMANIHDVDLGDSLTFEIETKGLPIAQRNSYNSNVTLLDSWTKTPVTIVPKVYSAGTTIDYIRILGNNFDFGKEIAKVAMSMIYAQFKLVTNILFDSANLTGTPLYQATFAGDTYVKNISYLQALNNASVKAYGTIPAFYAIGAIATTSYGFETQDEMIRNGFLGRAYGIDNIAINQATDLSAPFLTGTADDLMLVPNNKILLLTDVADKPVKLVRENYIKVINKDPNNGSLYRQEYSYFMSFEAGLATQAHYAIQGTAD